MRKLFGIVAITALFASGGVATVAGATILPAPSQSAGSLTFTVGSAGSVTFTSSGATSITLVGKLPAGVTSTNKVGSALVIHGTPTITTGNPYPLTLTAVQGVATATAHVTLVVGQAPAIATATGTTFTALVAGSYQFHATGYPAPIFTETGTLPSGVTLSTSGHLAGTPANGSGGSYKLLVLATNTVGSPAQLSFTLNVDQAPEITNVDHAQFTEGVTGTFQFTATGFPAPTFSVTGPLPAGLRLTSTTGVLSGFASVSGTFKFRVFATNIYNTTTQLFTLDIVPPPSPPLNPTLTSGSLTFIAGTSSTAVFAASGTPTPTLTVTGTLPTGLARSGGSITGKAALGTGGVYAITVKANNKGGNSSAGFNLMVEQSPAVTGATSAAVVAGSPVSFNFSATGFPAPTFSASNLPAGLSLSSSGALTGVAPVLKPTGGVITTPETLTLTISATNLLASANLKFSLTVNPPSAKPQGYTMVASDGGILNYGGAQFFGSMGGKFLSAPIVGVATAFADEGYWLVASDGGVFAFGNAAFYGSMGGKTLNSPIIGIAATPTGGGYWLTAADGGIFSFGDAGYFGSMGGKHLVKTIVAMAVTPNGKGYWLVAADGGIFAFGNAIYEGSMGGKTLNKPIVGMAATPTGTGYWLVASDGGMFSFGKAGYFGSTGGKTLNAPIVAMKPTPTGKGYWLVAADGGIFNFGNAVYSGSGGSLALVKPIVAIS